jgi:hypothetical protein
VEKKTWPYKAPSPGRSWTAYQDNLAKAIVVKEACPSPLCSWGDASVRYRLSLSPWNTGLEGPGGPLTPNTTKLNLNYPSNHFDLKCSKEVYTPPRPGGSQNVGAHTQRWKPSISTYRSIRLDHEYDENIAARKE